MKRKFLFSIVIVLVLIFALASCSSNDRYSNEGSYDEATESDEIDTNFLLNQSNRKIIYTFNINMVSDEFDKTADKIYELVQEDEEAANWIQDSERYQNDNYRDLYLTVRVKTDSLNDFLTGLASVGEISNQSHSTKDITYSYASTQARIAALAEEKEHLEALLDEVSASSKLLYIERISDINAELILLGQELTKYDSDVEYSPIMLTLI